MIPVIYDDKGKLFVIDNDKVTGFVSEFEKFFTLDDGVLPSFKSYTYLCCDLNGTNFAVDVVFKYLCKCNSQSAAGPDGFPGLFWHGLATLLCKPLSVIFIASYYVSRIPLQWKMSLIKPIYTKGDCSYFKNYRSVSLTCVPCRVMKAIIKDIMVKHLEDNKLLSTCQHGFRKYHLTGLQILECLNDWTKVVELGDCVDVCYMDFARAFDTFSILKLLPKISAYGFKGKLLKWLTDFFNERKLCVNINNVMSETITPTSGIAQGTSLGPLSFSLYINDLPLCLKCSICKLFADDGKYMVH